MNLASPTDTELVGATLAGSREAFSQIVSRYQSLICSLAYSATGNLGQSEDLAQETFITAWKHLGRLRERDKLRSWLGGIARNRINNFLRHEGREPIYQAEPLENAAHSPASEPLPVEALISREEQAILWRSLERIPVLYRDPLVLFYRENQSVERVAQALGLSEEAVHQRLSRGRKLLQEQVLAFVEGALERTRPEKAFTLGVIGALPLVTTTTKAAASAVTVTKGSSAASAVAATGLLGMTVSFSLMSFGNFVRYSTEMEAASSDQERARIQKFYRRLVPGVLALFVVVSLLVFQGLPDNDRGLRLFESLLTGVAIAYAVMSVVLSWRMLRNLRWTGAKSKENPAKPTWEYRSSRELFGLPLLHIRLGAKQGGPVKAWFAVGEVALGGLFAFGNLAVAPLSCGWLAVGLLPFGTCALGLLTLGGFSLGIWAFGALSIGWQAYGGCAIAWTEALGWLAFAHDYAAGGIAVATEANNPVAREMIYQNLFFKNSEIVLRYLAGLTLLWLIPTFCFWRLQRAHNKHINSSSENL